MYTLLFKINSIPDLLKMKLPFFFNIYIYIDIFGSLPSTASHLGSGLKRQLFWGLQFHSVEKLQTSAVVEKVNYSKLCALMATGYIVQGAVLLWPEVLGRSKN